MRGGFYTIAALVALWSGAAADAPRMAVLDLVPVGFDGAEAALLSARLRAELAALGRFELAARDDLYALMAGKGLDAAACDDACLEALGSALGARWVVSGSIRPRGRQVRIEAQLYDVQRQFAFSRIARAAPYDMGRLQEREMKRLAEELVPPDEGGGMPWWLLVVGGAGGAAWWAAQGDDEPGGTGSDPRGPGAAGDPGKGAAEVIGTFGE